MSDETHEQPKEERRPAASPYMLSLILFAMALWFAYDGFLNQEFMQKHEGDGVLMFNQIGAGVLFALAAIDFYRMRKLQARKASEAAAAAPGEPPEPFSG